jgi:hypothetical protein
MMNASKNQRPIAGLVPQDRLVYAGISVPGVLLLPGSLRRVILLKIRFNTFYRTYMRAQSKPFTVEIKSSRRADRRQEKSIWGSIDLTAIADQVAEDSDTPAAVITEENKAR